tara:strand:- start:438 stop:929 length:492 start_codon:yes stop_codon:yes gene_type:complete
MVILILSASTVPVAKGHPPSQCYHIAYTIDASLTHYSLIKNNSINIGNTLHIESNCETTFSLNGFSFTSNDTIIQQLPDSTTTFTITQNNQSTTYQNLTFYPSESIEFYVDDYNSDKTKSDSDLFTSELLAHAVTTIILFTFSTSLVYRLAKNRVDNSIEVVI